MSLVAVWSTFRGLTVENSARGSGRAPTVLFQVWSAFKSVCRSRRGSAVPRCTAMAIEFVPRHLDQLGL